MNPSRIKKIIRNLTESLEQQSKAMKKDTPAALSFKAMHDHDCAYQPRELTVSQDVPASLQSLYAALEKCDCDPTITVELVQLKEV